MKLENVVLDQVKSFFFFTFFGIFVGDDANDDDDGDDGEFICPR